jgi:chitinase
VFVNPSTVNVPLSGTQQFTATVSGTSNTTVNWSVLETFNGGSITSTGFYSAPSTAGTYHVIASMAADPSKTGIATITVGSGGVGAGPRPRKTVLLSKQALRCLVAQ